MPSCERGAFGSFCASLCISVSIATTFIFHAFVSCITFNSATLAGTNLSGCAGSKNGDPIFCAASGASEFLIMWQSSKQYLSTMESDADIALLDEGSEEDGFEEEI